MIATYTETARLFPAVPATPAGISSLGTSAYLLKNSRLGISPKVSIWEPRFLIGNQQNALGMRAEVRQNGSGSRCSGKERDAETNLDFFGARYFSGAQGRFTSPDEPLMDQDPSDPQSWNLYGYVRNNPLRAIDPNGRECVTLDNGGKGDDGTGSFCKDKGLLTTHGVQVNGTTGETTSWVFGNAVLMGDVDTSGRKDRIYDQTAEIANNLPWAKTAMAATKLGLAMGPLAVVITKEFLAKEIRRHAFESTAEGVSKFAAGIGEKEIEAMVQAALQTTGEQGQRNVTIYTLDLGKSIGTNQAGQASTTIKVFVDNTTKKAISADPF